MTVFSKIRGTIETLFEIGLGGPQLKNDAGEIDARNAADAAFVNVRGADPVIADDLTTKRYVDTLVGTSGAVREIRFPIGTAAAQDSVTSIPAGAVITAAELDIQTPYSPGATISIGQIGFPAAFMATTDNLATVADLYQVMQDTPEPFAGSSPVLVTVGGAPVAGAGFAIVRFTVPDA